ncbi:MAG TPA: TlyA family RNA methyltransferase [Deltaproteobacteria bacterium]|nr:TlyA family RNA methyltransferase [Deltaproteobacteria bacterium]
MKVRLDTLLVEKGYAETRSKALALVMAGSVLINGKPVTKAGTSIDVTSEITLKQPMPYVSRAGLKLEAALDTFQVNVLDRVGIDIGASTGGFTDVMIKRGIAKVYAVDVGHGQLHWSLRNHERVITLEKVNARMLDSSLIPEKCDIATFDVSFISLKLVISPVMKVLKPSADIIALIKPQFEAGRHEVKKGGIIRDSRVVEAVLTDIQDFFSSSRLAVSGVIPSPIRGSKGNQEYLIHATTQGAA